MKFQLCMLLDNCCEKVVQPLGEKAFEIKGGGQEMIAMMLIMIVL